MEIETHPWSTLLLLRTMSHEQYDGGRSGRGRCATCRCPTGLWGQTTNTGKDHITKSKDINTVALIPDLIESGVILEEGRKKKPEYALESHIFIVNMWIYIWIKEGIFL